jgi:membrane fusion protein, multidrug efflux system
MDETVDRVKIAPAERPLTHDAPPPEPPSRPARKRGGLVKWIVVLILGVGCVFAWEQFQKHETAEQSGSKNNGPPPQTIRDAPVVSGDMPIYINALGAVTPLATVTIRTQVSGQLQKVGFEEGQMVKAGDFLAQIDPRPFEATLAQNQAQLAKDTALRDQAQADLERYQTLNRQDSIAKQQVDDQEFLVRQDQAAMASDQAQIDSAKLNILYAHIVAPTAGRMGLRQVDPGNYVQPTDTNGLVVLTELEPISVVFTVPEDNLPQIFARLKTGAKLPVTIFDRANVNKLSDGVLATVDNQVDVTTGTVKIRAMFDNKDDALFPQQFVNARLLVDTMANAVIAPNAAIQQGAQGPFVYVVNDAQDGQTVSVRQVTTGPIDGQRTAINSGLKVGERVVIDGLDRLRDGAKIIVRNAPAQNGAPGAKPGETAPGQPGEQRQHRHRQGQGQSDQGQ